MYNCPRAATVTASKRGGEVGTWALDRATFQQVVVAGGRRQSQKNEEFLSKVAILEPLSASERATVADSLELRTYKDGECIIQEGADGGSDNVPFFILEAGGAIATQKGTDEKTTYSTGDYFGELSLLNAAPRAATVRALGACTCRALPKAAFLRLMGPISDILKRNAALYAKHESSIEEKAAIDEE